MPSIAFICTANVCRSPMAHAICAAELARRGLNIAVLSAGLSDLGGMLIADEARRICWAHQTWLPKFASTFIAKLDLTDVVRAFVMQHNHVPSLLEQTSLPPERITLLGEFDPHQRGAEIDDPIGQKSAVFEQCYERLRDCIVHYLD